MFRCLPLPSPTTHPRQNLTGIRWIYCPILFAPTLWVYRRKAMFFNNFNGMYFARSRSDGCKRYVDTDATIHADHNDPHTATFQSNCDVLNLSASGGGCGFTSTKWSIYFNYSTQHPSLSKTGKPVGRSVAIPQLTVAWESERVLGVRRRKPKIICMQLRN